MWTILLIKTMSLWKKSEFYDGHKDIQDNLINKNSQLPNIIYSDTIFVQRKTQNIISYIYSHTNF